jgi:hypothetical protein
MSSEVVIQFGVFLAIVAIGICGVYVVFRIRAVLLGASTTMEQVNTDTGPGTAVPGAATEQFALPPEAPMRSGIVERMPANTASLPPQGAEYTWLPKPESAGQRDYVRLRKEYVGERADVRFSVLREWISVNMLAIFRRVSRDWRTAKDLVEIVPSYLEPEAEVFRREVLLIGTRGHAERLAIPIRQLDASSPLAHCFDFVAYEAGSINSPAVVVRRDDQLKLVSKGSVMGECLPRIVLHEQEDDKGFGPGTVLPEADYDAVLERMEKMLIAGFSMQLAHDNRKRRDETDERVTVAVP